MIITGFYLLSSLGDQVDKDAYGQHHVNTYHEPSDY